MPRTILGRGNRTHEKIQVLLNGTVKARGKTREEISNVLGCSPRTVATRLTKPETITLGELITLGRYLDISIDELRQSIRY